MENTPLHREPETARSSTEIALTQEQRTLEPTLTAPQQAVLEWLVAGGSVADAAQLAGVARQTISRWLRNDPDFRAVHDAWKAESNELLQGRLAAAGDLAMDTLLTAVRNHDLRASQFVIKALLARPRVAE